MANDIRMQDPRLRDPINNISDGLKDIPKCASFVRANNVINKVYERFNG